MLFLIGLFMGNSQKAEGKLVSWYLNTGNYRPVSFSSVSHKIMQQLKADSINEELKDGSITNASLCVFIRYILQNKFDRCNYWILLLKILICNNRSSSRCWV